jgi:hypothetical protein
MHYILGTLARLGVGFIGLLIEIHKQDKQCIASLEGAIREQNENILKLAANQKPVPWNKGKKYKLPRKPKEETRLNWDLPTGETGIELFTPRID